MMDVRNLWNEAIAAAEAEYEADIYFYSGSIDDEGFGLLTKAVAEGKRREKAVLILVTNGGLANAAFQIARFLQTQYEQFSLFCPSRCKSAGTLIALGASELIMDPFSELGPLDVQLVKQNEIFARKSGLLARSAFDAMADSAFELYERLMVSISLKSGGNVSFKLASELSASMASTMMAPIYAQINPETVGGEHRDLNIAYEYGSRLIECSNNASIQTVFKLVYGYPSHDFIIDSREAEEMFQKVSIPTENLYRMVGLIGDAAYNEAEPSLIRALEPIEIDDEEEGHDNDGNDGENDGIEAVPATDPSVDDRGDGNRPGDPEAGESDEPRSAPAKKSPSNDTDEASHKTARDIGSRLLNKN